MKTRNNTYCAKDQDQSDFKEMASFACSGQENIRPTQPKNSQSAPKQSAAIHKSAAKKFTSIKIQTQNKSAHPWLKKLPAKKSTSINTEAQIQTQKKSANPWPKNFTPNPNGKINQPTISESAPKQSAPIHKSAAKKSPSINSKAQIQAQKKSAHPWPKNLTPNPNDKVNQPITSESAPKQSVSIRKSAAKKSASIKIQTQKKSANPWLKNLSATMLLLFTLSCSNTKYLKEGELLYLGADVEIKEDSMPKKNKKALKKELEGLTRPRPNKSILGLRPKLYIWNLAGEPKKEKGLRNWLRTKVGEEPVLFHQVDLDYNAEVLQSYAQNKGYFKAIVSADSTRRGKKAKAKYTVTPGPRYTIKSVTFPKDSVDSDLDSTIARTKRRSLLKVGDGFDLDVVKGERDRIDSRLKQKGYFFFNPDYLKVQVDSTIGEHKVDLFVRVKEETPAEAKKVYLINDVFIYPNFNVRKDTIGIDSTDVTYYNDFVIIDKQNLFKPRIFDRTMYFKKGDVYSRTAHNLTLSRLTNLGVFKFVKNDFKVVDDEEGNKLDAFYYLTPLPKKSIRIEVLGKTNSANYTGSELNVNWSNRNTFKGAELLQITAFGGIEVQVSGQNKGFNVYRVGGEANLVWPRFISPFKLESASGFMPRTRASLGYEYQMRQQLYSLNSFKGSFGYLWKENARKEHELKVSEVTYVNPGNVTDLYRERIEEDNTGTLEKVIRKQLIFGPVYTYTYTNTMRQRKKHTIYFKGMLDVAGTIAGFATGANIRNGDTTKVFGVPFSQYVKAEADFRHYWKLGGTTQLASRVIGGYGHAYGNSYELPFIKQFFIGGTNSIRAFRARSLGPGTYRPDVEDDEFLPDQSGDIKIELNTELRQKLFSIVHGAVFVDAGNIWLRNNGTEENPLPGAKFTGKFLSELAVGTGLGLRFDLSFLVLRTDLAFPLRKPWLPENDRWVLDSINFSSSTWRKENLVFNLAIGYPF